MYAAQISSELDNLERLVTTEGVSKGERTIIVDNLLETIVVGSHLHKTNVKDSDLDVKLIYMPRNEDLAIWPDLASKPLAFKTHDCDYTLVPVASHINSLLTGNMDSCAYIYGNTNSVMYRSHMSTTKTSLLRSYASNMGANNAFETILSCYGNLVAYRGQMPEDMLDIDKYIKNAKQLKALSKSLWLAEMLHTYVKCIAYNKPVSLDMLNADVVACAKEIKVNEFDQDALLNKAVNYFHNITDDMLSYIMESDNTLSKLRLYDIPDKKASTLAMLLLKEQISPIVREKSYVSNKENKAVASSVLANLYLG